MEIAARCSDQHYIMLLPGQNFCNTSAMLAKPGFGYSIGTVMLLGIVRHKMVYCVNALLLKGHLMSEDLRLTGYFLSVVGVG